VSTGPLWPHHAHHSQAVVSVSQPPPPGVPASCNDGEQGRHAASQGSVAARRPAGIVSGRASLLSRGRREGRKLCYAPDGGRLVCHADMCLDGDLTQRSDQSARHEQASAQKNSEKKASTNHGASVLRTTMVKL